MQITTALYANWVFLAIVSAMAGASANLVGLWQLRRNSGPAERPGICTVAANLFGLLTALLLGLLWSPDAWTLIAVVGATWSLAWVLASLLRYRWRRTERLFLVFFVLSELFYAIHKALIIRSLDLDLVNSALAMLLTASEAFTLVACLHSVFDVLIAMNAPERRALLVRSRATAPPFVSLHVPVCNEPPAVVIDTLNALARLDYPNYEVIVVSNNTPDSRLWRPVEKRCRQLGFRFYHFEHLEGYKAGALNRTLQSTSEKAELIGIVDSDNIARPEFLRNTVPLFDDPRVGFVQTRQDYRGWQSRAYHRGIYPLYRFFYDIVMVTRHAHNSSVFCGSMGLVRAKILRDIGGWDERCVTEDAEASLRILQLGYRGLYLPESYGFGLLPQTFGDTKGQWFRWMVGAAQIVRKHRLYTLLRLPPNHKLSWIQRWDYLMGGSMSFGALLMLMSTLFVAMATALILCAPQRFLVVFCPLTTSIAIFSYFLLLTMMTSILSLKVKMGFPWKDALFAFSTLLALSATRGRAFLCAFTRRSVPFRRTSKFRVSHHWARTLSSVTGELTMGALALVIAVTMLLYLPPEEFPFGLLILLGWQMIAYSAALHAAIRSSLS